MWQLYTLASLFFSAFNEVTDKVVIAANPEIDTLAATLYRNVVYFLFAVLAIMTGILGPLTFIISWQILLVAALSVGSALFYTYLLKHVELTGSSALSYCRPAIFLLIDILIMKATFSGAQIIGMVLLIFGAMMFVVNPMTKRLKPEYNKYVWLIFLYETFVYSGEYYIFKHYAHLQNLNEVSYIFSVYFFVVAILLSITLWKSDLKKLKATALNQRYIPKITLSKGLDFISSILWYRALTMAAVSQVSAIGFFYPLILLVIVYITQQSFKLKAGENFERSNLLQKTIGTAVLIVGIWSFN